MKRKLLSLTLVLALVLSMLPMGAFAAAVTVTSTLSVAAGGSIADATQIAVVTPGAALTAATSVIRITFPTGTTLNAANIAAADFNMVQADPDGVGAATAGAVTAVLAAPVVSVANRTIDLVVPAAAVSSTGLGALTIATTAGPDQTEFVFPSVPGAAYAMTVAIDAAADATFEDSGSANATVVAAAGNRFTSVVSVDKTQVAADGVTKAEFTVYTYDQFNNPSAGTVIAFASSRGATDTFSEDVAAPVYITAAATANNAGQITTGADGKAVVFLTSGAAGTSKVGFALTNTQNTNLVNYLNGNTAVAGADAVSLGIIGSTKDVTFTADSVNTIVYQGKTSSPATPKANGLDYHELTFRVQTSTGAPVAGEKVEFIASDSALTFNESSKTTDGAGLVKVKVYSTKLGTTFTVQAKAAGKTVDSAALAFAENGAYNLEAVTGSNLKIAKDTTKKFKVRVIDQMGTVIDCMSIFGANAYGEPTTVTFNSVSGPALTFSVESQPSGASLTLKGAVDTDGYARIETNTLKTEGKYVVRAALSNGKKVDFAFEVVRQGDIKDMNFYYDEKSIKYNGGTATSWTLESVDAAGITKSLSLPDSNIVFTSSDNALATVATNGTVTVVTTDKDDIGKKFVITVSDKSNKLSKSYEFAVGGAITAITAKDPGKLEANKQALLSVSLVDTKGNVTSGIAGGSTVETVVLSKPEGAIVSADAVSTFAADLTTYGAADLKVTSNKEGTVKLQIIVKNGANNFSTIVELKFGANSTVVAGKTLVLNMGSTTGFMNNNAVSSDLAPFIKDGRAFVPVSFIAAQLGGTAEFTKNAAGLVDTVTVKSGTTTVTMTIGSTTIKVVKDGKESTVTSDVAPFIKSGRTVLPFRAIAEAMGATVSFGPATGAVEWVKFTM